MGLLGTAAANIQLQANALNINRYQVKMRGWRQWREPSEYLNWPWPVVKVMPELLAVAA